MASDTDDVPTSILAYGVNEDGHWCPDKNTTLLSYNSANVHSMSPCREIFENLRPLDVIGMESGQHGHETMQEIGTLVTHFEHDRWL